MSAKIIPLEIVESSLASECITKSTNVTPSDDKIIKISPKTSEIQSEFETKTLRIVAEVPAAAKTYTTTTSTSTTTTSTTAASVLTTRTTQAETEPSTSNCNSTTTGVQDATRHHQNVDATDGPSSYVNANGSGSGNGSGVYKIIKTLGKGNFAKVKLALHVPTGREVAIKVIDKTQLNASAKQKLYREVRIMKLLNHPNIVRLFQVIESERTLYLVMEYASRGELFDHLVKNGRMRERDARTIFRQLVSAVQYCHSKFVVHRDLKAENLLLDSKMNIKIADFGFGNTFDPNAQLETFCGSPPYAAPELFMGRKYAGPEVDAWSLGVVLYTLVSGSLPFDGGTLKELRERVLRGKYRVPYYISMDCENLMRKFLVLNPAKRTTLNGVMSDKWINQGYDDSERLSAFREKPAEQQDPVRLDLLVGMGYKRRDVEHSIRSQLYDDIYCTYKLLGIGKNTKQSAESPAAGTPTSDRGGAMGMTRCVAPRVVNIQPSIINAGIGLPAVPPAKPTRRTPVRKPTNSNIRSSAPQTPQGKRSSTSSNNTEVKPTLLSSQRQQAQAQKLSNTPTRYTQQHHQQVGNSSSSSSSGSSSTRRPTTVYEKATPPSPLPIPRSPVPGQLLDRLQITKVAASPTVAAASSSAGPSTTEPPAEKFFARNNTGRATFHFGQSRAGKSGRNGAGGDEETCYQMPPLSADDTKPASRVSFFSKLTARFGRRVIHLNEKDATEQRKNLTK